MKNIITVATVNFTADWGDKESNLTRILEYAEAAGKRGADLVILPETALTGYDDDPQSEFTDKMHVRLAEPIPGPSTLSVAEIAKKYDMYVVFGMAECLPDDPLTCYNSAAIIHPNGTCSSYRKMHLPYFLKETEWGKRGNTPGIIDTPWGPVGICICWETYLYPEMLRYYRGKGCRMVINITATPAWPAPMASTKTIPVHCLVYSLFIATAGLCGLSKETKFYGGSSVIGPDLEGKGAITYIGKAAGTPHSDDPEMFIGTVDLSIADRYDQFRVSEYCEPIKSAHYRPELYAEWFKELSEKN